jgi:vacuolar-type H+-ATPase subunit C/Vma6
VAATRLDPVMRAFFVFFIDLRNLVLAYKHLRWRVAGPCRFIAGGSVEPARMEEIVKRGELAELDDLATAVTGQTISIAESEGALETILLRSMNQRLLHLRPAMDGVGWIVIHLWRVYVEARNLALLHHGAGVDPAVLERELIV